MTSPRQDPYLWWHLAGAATLPLWLDGCLAGLAVGDPVINVWLEQGLLIALGITLPLGLQWRRPIYLFRVGPLALSAEALTENQVRWLSLQRGWPQKVIALLTAIALSSVLVVLYGVSPIAAATTPFASLGRTPGWLICAGCFAIANWFGQTAISALGLFLAKARTLEHTQPYDRTKISQDFSGMLIQVGQVLPKQWLEAKAASPEANRPPAPADSSTEVEQDYSQAEAPVEAAIVESIEPQEPLPNDEAEPEATENGALLAAESAPLDTIEPPSHTAKPDSETEGIQKDGDIEHIEAEQTVNDPADESDAETTSPTEVAVTNDTNSIDPEAEAPESSESA
ncbi:MAG: low-complexity tail membrane protein [Leptolyngbyaceae cyanobacterium]